MIRQLKFLLVAHLVYCIIRMMMYSWDHGYDAIFDLRFIQVIISMVGAAIVASLEEIFKVLRTNSIRSYEPINFTAGKIFQSLDLAPAPEKVPGSFVYIEDDNRVYSSDGVVWKPV